MHYTMHMKRGPGRHLSVIPADTLTDQHIIADHSLRLLLQYHIQCFHSEIQTWTLLEKLAPTVVGKHRGGIWVDITT